MSKVGVQGAKHIQCNTFYLKLHLLQKMRGVITLGYFPLVRKWRGYISFTPLSPCQKVEGIYLPHPLPTFPLSESGEDISFSPPQKKKMNNKFVKK